MTMTDITDADLARILARANDPNECNLTPYWWATIPALVAALREARQVVALGHKIADSYEWGECQDVDQREFANRAARIAALAQYQPADGAGGEKAGVSK
jgi:hypothetical protein